MWDKGGTFYEIGCTTTSLQYWMDTNGTRHNYQWDVDKIIAPNEGPSASVYRLMLLTYVQDTASNNGQLTYSYPLQVPPGPGGFEPQLL
ncbi:MAG TPA: hypothetical protein VKT25_04505, partial [Ktedonobacteraceae bacterium]|nr:hypothetical protein [Ktedonobacteraceae bacterium]